MAEQLQSLQERQFQLDADLANVGASDTAARKELYTKYLSEVSALTTGFSLPSLSPSWSWFNTSSPLTADHFSGRLTVLDFFTYCCVNCLHILPDLERLERTHPDVLVVGVHSAKFENERVSENIAAAVRRYNITHPVVNDAQAEWWAQLGIACWPTLLVLGPDARPIRIFVGEGHGDALIEFTAFASEHFREQLSGERLPLPPPTDLGREVKEKMLSFPGKVFASGDRLFIADTSNRRVVVASDGGVIQRVLDGFVAPQGVCFNEKTDELFLADCDANLIKRVNLKTGQDSSVTCPEPLSTPWDVCLGCSPQNRDGDFDTLYVAVAGKHQIWALALDSSKWWKGEARTAGEFFLVAGNGKEENRNNSYPLKSGFAQPSGVVYSRKHHTVYVADSESSSVRQIRLGENGAVKNVCGGSRDPTDLFAYGDADGSGVEARLQHPLGVTYSERDDVLFVADSYNHKIKKVTALDGKAPKVETLEVNGLNEPGGICLSQDASKLYVADTNNSAVKAISLDVDRLPVKELECHCDQVDATEGKPRKVKSDATVVSSAALSRSDSEKNVVVRLNLQLPESVELNQDAPSSYTFDLCTGWQVDGGKAANGPLDNSTMDFDLQHNGSGDCIRLRIRAYLCSKVDGTCSVKNLEAVVNLNWADGSKSGDNKLDIQIKVP